MALSSVRTPTVTWAQRKDRLFITIEVMDCVEPKILLENEGKLSFAGKCGPDKLPYAVELDFYGPVNKDESKIAVTPRYVFFLVMKTEEGPHWPRLLKEKGKPPQHIKVDWNKYKDEEEEEEENNQENFDLGELDDMAKFDEFHDEELDSDDEDLPELEEEEKK